MASSSTEIANLALVNFLGQKSISSISEGSRESIVALATYANALAFVTETYHWRFARGRANLAELSDNDREDEWTYAYQRPSDCYRLRYLLPEIGIFDPNERIEYELEGDTIYTDEPNARAIYIKQVTDVSKFPPSFVFALAWYMAHLMVQPLELDKKFLGQCLDGFRQMLDWAVKMGDAEENFPQYRDAQEAQPDYMLQRGG